MTITILYFQALRDAAGRASEAVELADGASAAALVDLAIDRHPRIAPYRPALMIAVNEEWAPADTVLSDGDTVALTPPVSGG